jgi:NADPH-dependent curcumin reductase CurA
MRTREYRLAERPAATPEHRHFELAERELPDPGEGEALVENVYLSVDPYMRGRMRAAASYAAPYEVGEPMYGGAVGRVLVSGDPALAEGDWVVHNGGWREHALAPAKAFTKIDADAAPPSAYLGVLGMPGLTAYVGVLDIAEAKEGDQALVSGAAGAVGSVAGQIARIHGCRVAGSAGSAEKVAYLEELGFDAAFNYRDGTLGGAIDHACPDGVDVCFENVGGDHLRAALPRMRTFGRVALCGMISQYNLTEPEPGPPLASMVPRRLTMRGFIVSDHAHRRDDFLRDMTGWVADGRVRYRETVLEGFERMPDAFLGLFSGENVGKMLVRVA